MNRRSRLKAWWRRSRRIRAAKKQQAPLREFVYLDDVSVYSLIASKLGPIATEFTSSETTSLSSDVSGSLGANAGLVKTDMKSSMNTSQSSGSQVLRKSIVQTTFKELYELERDRLLLRPMGDESPPTSHRSGSLDSLLAVGEPWVMEAETLKRGSLVEVEVELQAEPIYRNSAIVSTMLQIVRESPELSGTVGHEQVGQVESFGRVLERLLAGLVPIRARLADYVAVEVGGRELLVHRDLASQLSSDEADVFEVYLVGVAEEALFWKDIRRILFSGSSYRVLARVSRSGVQASWTPVKLADVLRDVVPDFAPSLEAFNMSALNVGEESPEGKLGQYREMMVSAVQIYASGLADSLGQPVPTNFSAASCVEDVLAGDRLDTLEDRRRLFDRVTAELQEGLQANISAVDATHLRTAALLDAGFDFDGQPSLTTPVSRSPEPVPERFLDVEFVAIYW